MAQVLDPFPQTSHPRKEKKQGHIHCNQFFSSLIPGSRYKLTFIRMLGKVFLLFSVYLVLCIKELLRLSLISLT